MDQNENSNNIAEEIAQQEVNDDTHMLDGGFAVVDRERLIEEETREVKPWHKYFIEAFTAPRQMLEECYGQEPYRGASYGIVGGLLFTTLYLIITFINPVVKALSIEGLRNAGIAEDKISGMYSTTMIGGVIGGIIGFFLSTLLMAVFVQIMKAIFKDRASFANIYKMLLVVYMVSSLVLVVDGLVSYAIGVTGPVFQVSTLLGDISGMNLWLRALLSLLSLSNIILVIWMVIGYDAVTHSGLKKAVGVAVVYELLAFFFSYGGLYLTEMSAAMVVVN